MSYSWLNWLGLITGIIYVALSARNNPICWIFGIISCGSILYIDVFTEVALYSDALLQFFYIILGVYGLYTWTARKKIDSGHLPISSRSIQWHLKYIFLLTLISWPFGQLMSLAFGGALPILDAWTTVISVWATVLLTRRVLGNWIYWIILDMVYVYLYFVRGIPVISALFVIYTVFAIYGFTYWRKVKRPAII